MENWIDISLPIHPSMAIWPGNPGVELDSAQCMQHGDVCNVSQLKIGTHTGTHVDAINHFIKNGAGIDAAPLDHFIGPARVVAVESERAIHLSGYRRGQSTHSNICYLCFGFNREEHEYKKSFILKR